MVFDLTDGQTVPLLDGFFFARYVSTGHLILAQATSLFAAPFDPETLEVGTPVKILDGIVTGRNLYAEYSVSRSGTLAYLSGTSDFERTLVTVNRAGEVQQLDDDAYPDLGKVSFSPDGSRLALTMFQGPGMDPTSDYSQQHVFVYDLARGGFDRITVEPHDGFWPVWTPDGRSVVFSSMRNGQIDIYSRPADRSGPSALLYASEYDEWPSSWSPDDELAFQQEHPVTRHDVWIYSAESGQAHVFRSGPADERNPAFSPDGRWLAYQSGALGQWEIYVTAYPGPGPDCKVSIAGGEEPHWSGDGTELFYRQGSTAMVADVSNQDFCRAESTPLFEGPEERIWDVSPVDSVVVTVAPRESPNLHLVQDWFEELKRLVPID